MPLPGVGSCDKRFERVLCGVLIFDGPVSLVGPMSFDGLVSFDGLMSLVGLVSFVGLISSRCDLESKADVRGTANRESIKTIHATPVWVLEVVSGCGRDGSD